MKPLQIIFPVALIAVVLAGCSGNTSTKRSTYKPILMDKRQLATSISFLQTKAISRPGEVRTNTNLLLIVEQYEGVHIYDNSNSFSPVEKGFLVIPGCMDIVLNNNTLYASNATDLVTIDVTDPANPQVLQRIPNVFPELNAPDGYPIEHYLQNGRPQNTVVVNWLKITG